MSPPTATRGVRLALGLGGVVVALIICEVASRYGGIGDKLNGDLTFHPRIGWTHLPNARFATSDSGRIVALEFNSLGFRDIEHPRAKPPGVKRIVLIGDSFAESVQVNLYDTFFRRLQEKLGSGWEIINLGVGDFSNV